MSVFKRGEVYWYEFSFNGARIRESAKTSSKTIAREAKRQRRRELELGINGLTKRERPPLFPAAAKEWFESKTALTPLGLCLLQAISRQADPAFREPAGFRHNRGRYRGASA